jgi:hypothetical protein
LSLRGQGMGCAATALIVCLVGYLQSRVRNHFLSGGGKTLSSGRPAACAVATTGDAMASDAPRWHEMCDSYRTYLGSLYQ